MSNRLTIEEMTMVRDLILLPYIDTMVGKSIKELEGSGNVLTQTYLMAGRYMQKRIMQDTYDLKRQLKQRDIRYEEDQNDDFVMYFMIYYRGYQERFGMTRDVMKTEISLKLTQYSSEFGEILKNTK
jgi:hypothetical protein